MNRDSKPDLVVASGTSRSLTVLLGKGDGHFARPKPNHPRGQSGEMALAMSTRQQSGSVL